MRPVVLIADPAFAATSSALRLTPPGPGDLAAELSEQGLELETLQVPLREAPAQRIVLYVTLHGLTGIEGLSPELRRRLFVLGYGMPDDAPAHKREELGLLGVVGARGWQRWTSGMLADRVIWGQPEVVRLAGLTASAGPSDAIGSANLPAVLAAYLKHAQQLLAVDLLPAATETARRSS